MDEYPELPLPFGGDNCHFKFRAQLVGKKMRYIGEPNRPMRKVHDELVALLYAVAQHSPRVSFESSTAAMPGRSLMLNAALHRESRYFYNFDLHNAFPSVNTDRLALALFALEPRFGGVADLVHYLESHCIAPRGGLIVGSPSSPLLFNIYCAVWVDRYVREVCAQEGMVFSRYIDDYTISSKTPIWDATRVRIRKIVEEAGLSIHHRKSHLVDIERGPVSITGVRLWKDGRRSPTSEFLGKMRFALRKRARDMTKEERGVFAGLAAHLNTFLPHYATNEVPWLQRKVNARLRELTALYKHERTVQRKTAAEENNKYRRRSHSVAGFPAEFLDRLRLLLSKEGVFEAIVAKKVKLKPPVGKGKDRFGLCPFHNEKTASFSVVPSKGFFHCFGCGEHGDVITFLMKTEHSSFAEVVEKLARWCNMSLPPKAGR